MSIEDLAYVTSFDLNYYQGGAVLLGSLSRQLTPGQIVYVLTSDEAELIRAKLKNLEPLGHLDLRIINVSTKISLLKTMQMDNLLHFSNAAIYRLYMEFLLPAEIRKVIYLDSDTLVVDSIEEMKKTENLFSAVVESGKDGYFNSGVFQTDLVFWRDNNLIEQFEKYLNENPNSLYKDQDALNFVFGSRNKDLDPKFNFQVKNRHSSRDVAILHFSGSRKPWYRSTPNDYYVNIWRTYAKEILGSEYKLTKRRFDLIRKMILNLESLISK